MSQFSPGPWRWDRNWLVDADGNPLSRYMAGDARLIAAAPRMMELLRQVLMPKESCCDVNVMLDRNGAAVCSWCRRPVDVESDIKELIAEIDGTKEPERTGMTCGACGQVGGEVEWRQTAVGQVPHHKGCPKESP